MSAAATAPLILPQVVDGFSYNTMLQYLPERYFPNALAQMDALRRAAGYRARWITAPDDIAEPIQPYDTYQGQFALAGNSYLWGYHFSSISATDPTDAPVATTATDLCLQVSDSCSSIPIFQDFINGNGAHSNFTARCFPILLSKPRLILDPGLVTVEIANRTANTIFAQLILMFAESCRLVDEQTRREDWAMVRAANKALAARGLSGVMR